MIFFRKITLSERAPAGESNGWSCYLLECADGTYYAGVAPDVAQRVAKHNAGRGAKYTRGRRPVRLVWSQRCGGYGAARKLEAHLKRLPRKKKQKLIQGSLDLPRYK